MVTLLEAQKTINADPYVTCTVGGSPVPYVGRYKYWEKANSPGRCSLWLDNSGGRFDDLAGDWPAIKRGKEVIISRGLRVGGQNLSAALPTVWVETIMFVLFKDTPYLVLDCIDWIGRLRYYRFSATQTYTATTVQSIVSTLLGEVGLTLEGSITSLTIDYEIRPTRSAWSAMLDLMAKVPEVLYAKPGKIVAAKELDAGASASYTFAYNPGAGSTGSPTGHPLLDDTDVAESTPLYNTITVVGGPALEYSATVADADEVTLIGYARRKYITDRRLSSGAQCTQRATAELENWTARTTAGVVVARPHFTARLYDVVAAPAPLWGGPAVGSGHITRIVEWYNYGSRKYDQALTLGEVPDAALLHLDDTAEEPLPIDDSDPGDPIGGDPVLSDLEAIVASPDDIGDGVIDTQHIADNAITQDKLQNDSIGTDELIDGSVTTAKIADDAVTATKIAGDIGLGAAQASPQGLLHGYDTVSGFLHWEHGAVAGTTQTIIANGTGDVTAVAVVQYAVKASGGTYQGGVLSRGPGEAVQLYNDTDGVLELRVTAGGALEIQRTSGTSTFAVAVWVVWL